MKLRTLLVVCAALALTVGVATATAGDGNSGNAKQCYKGGWIKLVRSDGTPFANQDDCVSYAAHGGTLKPKPPCTAGSEDFSKDDSNSQPTTFAGGTIEGPYNGTGQGAGRVLEVGPYLSFLGFRAGTHVMATGGLGGTFQLTFTNAVASLKLDAQSITSGTTVTLTAYDATHAVVGTETENADTPQSFSITSKTNNIKSFTLSSNVQGNFGPVFTNIVWACA